jgi:hypothetical protein
MAEMESPLFIAAFEAYSKRMKIACVALVGLVAP